MNTKQKLTLGIAAIFMVTLTIIGVTYAYFVTRVNYSQSATAVIKTAEIGAQFIDGVTTNLIDAMPDDKVYHLFAMKNLGETEVTYALAVGTYLKHEKVLDGDGNPVQVNGVDTYKTKYPEFVHTTLTDATTKTLSVPISMEEGKENSTVFNGTVGSMTGLCYMSNGVADAMATALGDGSSRNSRTVGKGCYDALLYNNITIKLYKLNEAYSTDTITTNTTLLPGGDDAGTVDEFIAIDLSRGGSYTSAEQQAEHEKAINETVADLKAASTCISGCAEISGQTTIHPSYYIGYDETKIAGLQAGDTHPAASAAARIGNGTAVTIHSKQTLAGGTDSYNYYFAEIEYVNNGKNQNIENNAFVGFKFDVVNAPLNPVTNPTS